MEQTFIMIKPDGVQRGLIGEVISRFEKKGFYLKAMKLVNVERSFAEKHYADLSSKPFFAGLVEYIVSGPVVAMVWEGKSVVATGRKIVGATNPLAAEPGTIRGDFAVDIGRNVIHGSDSVENGRKEIALWFPEGLAEWQSNQHPWIYEVLLCRSAIAADRVVATLLCGLPETEAATFGKVLLVVLLCPVEPLCRNVIHGSDSVENGRKEIALWFPEGLAEWQSNQHPWIYEV
ncbi:hypothetical protein EJB05_23351 [Eragrostis curvula]|uniref:Nucleoside diphosphate kinase n=1 Tax=Eragrostis curvula TaxID=38414 RepID=A0A5J9V6T3_9POAL|nr:hypothetical protein EJB05_23351 [Eragrostis curvula]